MKLMPQEAYFKQGFKLGGFMTYKKFLNYLYQLSEVCATMIDVFKKHEYTNTTNAVEHSPGKYYCDACHGMQPGIIYRRNLS